MAVAEEDEVEAEVSSILLATWIITSITVLGAYSSNLSILIRKLPLTVISKHFSQNFFFFFYQLKV